jgi:hypothetical protein
MHRKHKFLPSRACRAKVFSYNALPVPMKNFNRLRRGNSSVGRARPCQGRGREFESRFPLQNLCSARKHQAGIAQLVEHDLAKVGVASSSLVSRSKSVLSVSFQAGIAQLVEHDLAKVGVASSSLVSRSRFFDLPRHCGNSSVGRARPCQGRGREFESRFPLQILSVCFNYPQRQRPPEAPNAH